MYQELSVWKRINQRKLVRYRCFMNLTTKKFTVQSADSYYLPIDQKTMRSHDSQFIELLCESDPFERSDSFDSLAEAIAAHDRNFEVDDQGDSALAADARRTRSKPSASASSEPT